MLTSVDAWTRQNFACTTVPDKRLRERVCKVVTALASRPGRSIPELFDRPSDSKAAYDLFKHPAATPENLQSAHRRHVCHALAQPGTYLLIEDSTDMIWPKDHAVEGLGIMTKKGNRGFLLHSVIAVEWQKDTFERRPPLRILGIADQQFHARTPAPIGERNSARKKRPRESQLWQQAGQHLGKAPAGVALIRVCDRGADIYEFLRSCQELGHHFVVRAAQNRLLVGGGKLFDSARKLSSWGGFSLELRSRPHHPARTAHLQVSAQSVLLQSPERPGRWRGSLEPIACTVVRVWEEDNPHGEGLEWILLVDRPVGTLQEALECTSQYACRWSIEEFHKALKTGLGAEKLQLEHASRLFAAIALMSVVALRLVDLKERARLIPDAPAEFAGLQPIELEVLRLRLKREIRTVRDVAMAIGRLGGHMNRKADGMPGLVTLWRGMRELQTLVQGARLALQTRTYG